jgi:hypothetical protein
LTSQSTANATVSGWASTTLTSNDVLSFVVGSPATLTYLNLTIKINKT